MPKHGRHDLDAEYGSIASLYDPLTAPFIDPLRRVMVREAIRLKARRTLDICCGTGRFAAMLDRAGFPTSGIDLSPSMLDRAKAQCPSSVSLVHADATHLPFCDASFDLVTVAFALHEKSAPVRLGMLHEALRVLAPHGHALVHDYRVPRNAAQRIGHLGVQVFERAAGREHHGNYRDYLLAAGLPPLAEQAGFSATLLFSHYLGSVGLYLLTPCG